MFKCNKRSDCDLGQLMRLRTCRDPFTIQCELCEIIRIVNASHAVGQTRYWNSTEGCSDVSFHQEFDCLLPADSQAFEDIRGSCNGYQTCELLRNRAAIYCGSLVKTTSCCVEIFYTCKERRSNIVFYLILIEIEKFKAHLSNSQALPTHVIAITNK